MSLSTNGTGPYDATMKTLVAKEIRKGMGHRIPIPSLDITTHLYCFMLKIVGSKIIKFNW